MRPCSPASEMSPSERAPKRRGGAQLHQYSSSRREADTEGGSPMSSADPRDIVLKPVVSEKSYALLDKNVYTFVVRSDATKIQIRDAIEQIFSVRVTKVNTLNRKGKRKRNRRMPTFGKRSDTKRAIVTLSEGNRIDLFET